MDERVATGSKRSGLLAAGGTDGMSEDRGRVIVAGFKAADWFTFEVLNKLRHTKHKRTKGTDAHQKIQ